MSKTITIEPRKDEPVDYETEIERQLKLLDEMHKEIAVSEKETARLREETWEIINQLKAA